MKKILIIGRVPPPVGGVTIHVQRLISFLKQRDISFMFFKLNFLNLFLLHFIIFKYPIIHLHSSNIYVMKWISMIAKVLSKKLIITFHGDVNRYNSKKLKIIKKIIKKTTVPILLNHGSFDIAIKINKNSRLISAFIPPFNEKKLQTELMFQIGILKKKHDFIYATNAYSLTYDKHNIEIYGILDLINYFKSNQNIALVISDPSSKYKEYLKVNNINLSQNVLLINIPHSFYEILKNVDGSIRNTSTDGDSLSVRESIFLHKLTLATNAVSRPNGTITYTRGCYSFSSFKKLMNESKSIRPKIKASNYKSILNIYNNI